MSSTQPVGVALVGVGGQAVTHLNALQHLQRQDRRARIEIEYSRHDRLSFFNVENGRRAL